MALTFDYLNKVISVPQADLTFVSGTFYTCDTNWLKDQILAELGSESGIWEDDIYVHNTEVGPIAGTIFARTIQIINGWTVEFTPDSQWTVQLEGSNNDIWSVGDGILVQNQVQVIPTNSAGLIVGSGGGGGATAAEVWAFGLSTGNSADKELTDARVAAQNAETNAQDAETAAIAADAAADAAASAASDAEVAANLARIAAESADTQAAINQNLITNLAAPDNAGIQMIKEAHFNRRKWDKVGNTITIYQSDDVTPLYVFDTNADLSDITPQ